MIVFVLFSIYYYHLLSFIIICYYLLLLRCWWLSVVTMTMTILLLSLGVSRDPGGTYNPIIKGRFEQARAASSRLSSPLGRRRVELARTTWPFPQRVSGPGPKLGGFAEALETLTTDGNRNSTGFYDRLSVPPAFHFAVEFRSRCRSPAPGTQPSTGLGQGLLYF